MKASELSFDNQISFLFKGPAGFAKTCAACSFAAFGDVRLNYWDKSKPIELFTFFHQIGRADLLNNIDINLYNSQNANEYLNDMLKLREDCRYVAVVTDSVTNMTRSSVNWCMDYRDPKGPKKDKLAPNTLSLTPDWDEYKVETNFVSRALDYSKALPCYNIWTAHPLPKLDVQGSGGNVSSVTKTQSIVSYGQKVGAMIPGDFVEIYHFGRQSGNRCVFTDLIGDDFAKTSLKLPKILNIEGRLFAEVWKEAANEGFKELAEINQKGGDNKIKSGTGSSKWKV